MHSQSSDSSELTPGEIYRILEDPRRRFVLSYLSQQDRSVDLSTLSKRIAAWEADTAMADVDDEHSDRVRASLHHKHLPILRDAGLIEYETGTVPAVKLVGDMTPLEPGLHVRQDEKLRDSYTT